MHSCEKVKKQKWYENNKERCNQQVKNWRNNNRDKFNEYSRNKRKTDEQVRIADNLRRRLNSALKSQKTTKSSSTLILLELPFTKFIEWLNLTKKYFVPDDYKGKLHIDHFVPISSFSLTDPIELKQAMHWSNLRYLTEEANISKSNKLSTPLEKFKMLVLKYYFITKQQ